MQTRQDFDALLELLQAKIAVIYGSDDDPDHPSADESYINHLLNQAQLLGPAPNAFYHPREKS